MTKLSEREAFSREIKILRQQGNLEPAELVNRALKVGLQPQEILEAIRDQLGHQSAPSTDLTDALTIFVSSLCGHKSSDLILEYTRLPYLLTMQLAVTDAAHRLSFVAGDKQLFEIFRILFVGRGPLIFEYIADIPPATTYGSILCSPPLGLQQPDDKSADGFGGEIVRKLVPYLSEKGTIYWITGRGVVFNPRAKHTLADLKALGLYAAGCIEIAPGAFPGTMIEGVVIALRHEMPKKRFVGSLRDIETAGSTADAFLSGPSRKEGPNWIWLDPDDSRTFSDLEQSRLLQNLMPRGRHTVQPLGTLLHTDKVGKADRPISDTDQAAAFLYIPEYAGSRVTTGLDEQTVDPKAVYRLPIDPKKANPRFLAQLFNSPYGKQLRGNAATGATIQRVSVASLLKMELPVPDIATQERIVRIDSDISLLQAAFHEMRGTIDQDWTALSDIGEKIDGLKAVLDIERQIADWWRELPYPLATIYRRYQVSTDPKERLDALLHFFEMAAVYLAAVGTSHVKALRSDWKDVLPTWLHPTGGAGIERADFGFWINLAAASLKDTNRIASDKELRAKATDIAGPELVQLASTIGQLGKATEVLKVPGQYRNSWKGHGGHMKASDAVRLESELQQSLREFYEITASIFRHLQLVRPGTAEVTDTGFKFQIEKLSGSDPTFQRQLVELAQAAKSNALAFWMCGARTMCRAIPFFRLGAPQRPQETSFYVFNRFVNGGFRWISYQETLEQEFVAPPDDELLGIIALERKAE
jgi:hypothetical protein